MGGNKFEERWLRSRLVRFAAWLEGGLAAVEVAEKQIGRRTLGVISPRTTHNTQSLAVMGGTQKVDEETDKSWHELRLA